MMIVRKRPRNESATNAQRSGRNDTVPIQAFTLAAAAAVDSPNGPVKYIIRFDDIPKNANRSAISTPTKQKEKKNEPKNESYYMV